MLFAGFAIGKWMMKWTYLQAAYFSTTTMLTIGYGDLNFKDDKDGRYCAIFFLPLTVFCTAATLGNVAALLQAHRLDAAAISKTFDGISSSLFDSTDDGIDEDIEVPAISREEFVLTMLRKLGLVSDVTLETLYMQFQLIDTDDSGFITKHDMELRMKIPLAERQKQLGLGGHATTAANVAKSNANTGSNKVVPSSAES